MLVGRDAVAVKAAATRFGWADAETDWRAAIARDDVDVVDICTPGDTHCEIALAALEAGKHVLVEKPVANSVAEAEQMVAAADAARERGRGRWSASTTGGCRRSSSPDGWWRRAGSAPCGRCGRRTSRTGWPIPRRR